MNTWADLVLRYWQGDQRAEMVSPSKNRPPVRKLVSLDRALDVALHTTLTKRLYTPVLVNAETGSLTGSRCISATMAACR